jgi:hypothetical protein
MTEIAVARHAAILRRAERGLGVAIRGGQSRGEVETLAEARSRAGRKQGADSAVIKPKPTDFADHSELSGAGGRAGIYGVSDGISDGQFEEAISEAKAEGNLSRANVARKCRCLDCRRPLRAPGSVAAQRGPVCRARAAVVA